MGNCNRDYNGDGVDDCDDVDDVDDSEKVGKGSHPTPTCRNWS